MANHTHDYRPVGLCQHPIKGSVLEHRVYRCECGTFAHSRTAVRLVRRGWGVTRCPVSLQQSEVEAWQQHNRERAGVGAT